MTQSPKFPMIAKTMAELEDVLAEELTNLGAEDIEIGNRMVSFTGDKALMYKTNVHCRTALRILKPIYEFKAETADEVYEAIKELDWDEYLSLDKTFSIDAVVFSHIFSHSKFVAYRVKDAIADWFMERNNKRPSVSVTNPDLVFNIHVSHKTCTLSLDSSGDSLHKRGYRIAETEAPLNEVLAAGMILKSGWRGESTFTDPMCGSGTLLIEAAMIALGVPPGIHRDSFGFEKWSDFDADLFSEIYNDDSHSREFNHRIIGSDISPKAISVAEKNIKNAGLHKYIDLSVMPFQQYTEAPAEEGVLITNPPYGERLKVEDLGELYNMIGERLKHVFAGWDVYVLSYRKELFDSIGLKPTKRFFLFNGSLECELRHYQIFSGKRVDYDEEDRSQTSQKRERRSERFMSAERNSREGYRRSRREAEEQQSEGEGDNRERRDEAPGERVGRAFDRFERRDSDRDRRPREFKPRNTEGRGFDRDRKFDRGDRKPRDFQRRDSDRDFKPRDTEGRGFDRDRKFDRGDRKPRDFQRRDSERDFKPRDFKPRDSERRTFDRDRSFDRDRKPREFRRSDSDSRRSGFDSRDNRNDSRSAGFESRISKRPQSFDARDDDRKSGDRKDFGRRRGTGKKKDEE